MNEINYYFKYYDLKKKVLNLDEFHLYDVYVEMVKDYDKKYYELVDLEKETGYKLPYSPTQRVGDVILPEFKKYTHKARLWSLDKAQTLEEIREWHNRNVKFLEEYNRTSDEELPPLKYILTKKFDGLTIN